ncbi:Aste57867_15058 [Aphanomyces stellatus]|uniref:Aste57867_15058 protein n=1 Tax=Aphanomyces stellatus TaxID=120398 RepID=A0A485L2I4_9STRA|nr:hypothetical protein As57867_015002 [Aphanomyces stellatus]VFT91872.1 Aste57867_15058 [Aphanomyces stellatus]
MTILRSLVVAVACLAAVAAAANIRGIPRIRKVVNFGDSSSDTGSGAFVLTKGQVPSNAYWNGRFSNGPTYIETVAALLQASLVSYATGGATTDNHKIQGSLKDRSVANSPLYLVPSATEQAKQYSWTTRETIPCREILYVIGIGNNDASFNTAFQLNFTGTAVANSQYEIWSTLANAGAVNIVVMVPPTLGSPFLIDYGIQLHKLAVEFKDDRPEVNLGLFEMPELMSNVLPALPAFGFAHSFLDPCCKGNMYSGLPPQGNVVRCANPDVYLMYDSVHATAAFHRIIGAAVVDFIQTWFNLPPVS